MKYDIEKQLKQVMMDAVLKAFDYRIDEHFVVIEIPKDTSLGDYATNVAMRLAKPLRKNPKVIAMAIIDKLDMKLVEAVNVAGAGFINIFIKQSVLASNILRILQLQDDYGRSDMGQNQKINLEYVSANPTGDLHPGHARGAAIGDSVARIMAFAGYDVLREFYVNDAGNQIHNMAKSLQARYYQAFDMDVAVPDDGYHGDDFCWSNTEIRRISNITDLTKKGYGGQQQWNEYKIHQHICAILHSKTNQETIGETEEVW